MKDSAQGKREAGYYHVRKDNRWSIIYWNGAMWYSPNHPVKNDYWDEVSEQRILNPDETCIERTQPQEGEYSVVFKHEDGRLERIGCTLTDLLKKSEEDFYEDLCTKDVCTSASCNNESQNFCDCPSMYEDFEFSHIEPHPTPAQVTEDDGTPCMYCEQIVVGEFPKMCCSGVDSLGIPNCGCMGMPIEPICCSKGCYEMLMNRHNAKPPVQEQGKFITKICEHSEPDVHDYHDNSKWCNICGQVVEQNGERGEIQVFQSQPPQDNQALREEMHKLFPEHSKIILDVLNERQRQNDKFGANRTQHPFLWNTILMEEVGEAAKDSLDMEFSDDPKSAKERYRKELIEVAAVAIAAIQDLDNNGIFDFAKSLQSK